MWISLGPGVLVGLLLFALPTAAQDDPAASLEQLEAVAAPDAAPLVADADELIGRIRERRQLLQGLQRQAASASGEDRAVLEERITGERLELLDDLHALADNVIAQEGEGFDASRYRAPLREIMQAVTPLLGDEIAAIETSLGEMQKKRETAEGAALAALEQDIVRQSKMLIRYSAAGVAHVEQLEALGLDAATARQFMATQLNDRAELLAARIDRAAQEVANARRVSDQAPDDPALAAEVRALQAKLDTSTAELAAAIEQMDGLGLENARYKQILIETTGEITADVFDREVALGLADRWMADLKGWFLERGPGALFKFLTFGAILAVFWVLARFARRLTERAVASPSLRFSVLLKKMIVSTVSSAVMVLGLLVGLSQLGIQLAPVLAGLGIAGFVIGFALQDTLANFAAGAMILAYRPYDVGDLIEAAGGVFGKVSRMNLVSTTILTLDHQTLVVPNGKIWGDVIKNVTAQTKRRVDLVFGISYSDDIPHTEEVLKSIVKEHPKVLADPEPVIKLHNLGDSSVDFVVRPWVKTEDYWDVYWDITREVKMRFDREGISIPFPQRDVHVIAEEAADEKSLDPKPSS